ncbi:MAG: class I SAM-dependent methyltransferase [Gemmatimonadales bacterium]
MTWQPVAGSFRDPSGFLFRRDGTLYRQVNRRYHEDYAAVVASGLYDELADKGLLVAHAEAELRLAATADAVAVLRPECLGFISYPYEWSFSQLRDAALLTLDVQCRALDRGLVLRDASAYNVQFHQGRPIFIDTLSFGRYREGEPWQAYRQFCQHFLAPLALMSKRDARCGLLLRQFIDGIPLDLASALLPWRTRLRLGLLMHLHVHARAQRRFADTSAGAASARARPLSRKALDTLVESLRTTVNALQWTPSGTEWADYEQRHNYTARAVASKAATLREFLAQLRPRRVWDVGANTGAYARVARETAESVIAFDVDPAAVERNYRRVRADGERGILPLLLDFTNPSPAHGWGHTERLSLEERGPADAVLALALVHHLAIGNNVPLPRVAEYFARLGRALIVEFVPKTDPQVQRLLRHRPDIFPEYTPAGFEAAFGPRFDTLASRPVDETERVLYLMRRKPHEAC